METAAGALSSPTGPPLVIGVSLTLYAGWLAPRLADFAAAHPEVSLKIHSLIGRETPPRDAALWISFGQPPPATNSIPLFGERLVPVAHPDIAASITSRDEMLQHQLIEVSDHRKNWAQVLDVDMLASHAKVTHVDTTFAALSLARSGFGLALARPPASDGLVETLGLVPCILELEIPGVEQYHLLNSANAHLNDDAVAFKSWIIDQAGRAVRKT
ncbi:MAG: LysR substrate-binding domain-containing protein [Pseudomonadota bacterium]